MGYVQVANKGLYHVTTLLYHQMAYIVNKVYSYRFF